MTKNDVLDKVNDYKEKLKPKRKELNDIDKRLLIYIDEVFKNPQIHNKYEYLAVFRFINLLYKYKFNKTEILKFFKVYETLKFPSNKGMQAFKLTPVQTFIFASIYGFYKEDGNRLTRDALLFVARKFSKTTAVAASAVYDLIFGENDAQVFVAANSYKQAQIAYNIIVDAIKSLDSSLTHFHINREQIFNKLANRTSYIRCLASKADKLDGLNASTLIMDEYAQSDTAEVKNVITSSMGMRKNPLSITITTASTKKDTPFTAMLSYYKKILEYEEENDSVFAFICEPDEDDKDMANHNIWKKCNPHLGITVREDFYKEQWKKALSTKEDMVEYKTKLLNLFCEDTAEKWITDDVIERYQQKIDMSTLKAKPQAMVAVDLSVRDDTSAVVWAMYDSINKRFWFKGKFYLPKSVLTDHPNKEFYQRLVNEGYLTICGDEVIDYQQIANDVIQLAKQVQVLQVGYDSFKSREFVNIVKAAGLPVLPVSQTYGAFTSSVDAFETALYNNKLVFDDNPLFPYYFNNCVIDTDRMENRKPMKVSQNSKIDGAICVLMCMKQFMEFKRRI